MPRGGARVGAGRPKKVPGSPAGRPVVAKASDPVDAALEPLDYMLSVMNDPDADPLRRDRMAVAAAPFRHPKLGEGGKKDAKADQAKGASAGRFAATATPLALVRGGK